MVMNIQILSMMDKMSDFMKLVIPLIGLTKEDISEGSGFCAAFDQDDNKPVNGEFVYLLYDPMVYNSKTLNKIRNLKTLYSTYEYRIDNKVYTIYKIKANDRRLENLLKGNVNMDDNTIARILQFWGFVDPYVNKVCLNLGNHTFVNNKTSIPIKDYQPPAFIYNGSYLDVPIQYSQVSKQ